MDLKLHANATTPRIRAYIQNSQASTPSWPANSASTAAPWRAGRAAARSSIARPASFGWRPWEEGLIVELRRSLALPLDDIVEAMRRCINPKLSRSAIHRCLLRHGVSARLTPQKAPGAAFHTAAPAGFIRPPARRHASLAMR